jgi:ABC-type transport system substrate-binding protein
MKQPCARLASTRGGWTGGPLALVAMVLMAALTVAATRSAAETRFVFANESPYDTMDPHAAFDVGRVAVRLNLYDGLYRWLDNPPVLHPWLAESHTVSPDGLTYAFKLRKGVKFHDGAEVTADDVVYSMERILALKKGAASLLGTMVSPGATKAVDKYTVQFSLTKPTAIFMAVMPEIHVVNGALLKKHDKDGDWGGAWLTSNDAGSGSYALSRYDPAIGFIARRFPGHFMPWGPKYIDEVEFRLVKEDNTRVLGMIKGDYQGTGGYLPNDQVKRLREAPNVKIVEAESMRIMMFQINTQRPPLNDVNVRRAISYAFDYDGFNKEILGGSVERNPVPIPNNLWGVPKDVKGYSYDVDKAKLELTRAKAKVDRVQPDGTGGDGDAERPPEDRHRVQARGRAVAEHGRADEEARDLAGPRRLLDQHVLRGSEQLDRRDVPLRTVGHVQGVELLQERQGGRAAGRGAPVHRPQGAREGLSGRRAHRGGGGARRVDLQHEILRPLGQEPGGHPLQSDRQRSGDALGLLREVAQREEIR